MIGSHNSRDIMNNNMNVKKNVHGDHIVSKYIGAFSKDMTEQLGAAEAAVYVCVALIICVGYHMASDGIFSSIVTLASVIQFAGLVLTVVKISKNKGFGSVSVKSLHMYLYVYVLRLACTLFNEGYLPVDISGDWAYQTADAASLAVVVFMLWRSRYDTSVMEEEYFPIHWALVACFIFATVCHPCHNMGAWSDVFWTSSVFLETFVMLPQLRLIAVQKSVEGVTSHAIACTAIYRGLNFYFWIICRDELVHGCPSSIPMYFVISALCIQTLLLCDFMFFYLKAVVHKASAGQIQLPSVGAGDIHLDV